MTWASQSSFNYKKVDCFINCNKIASPGGDVVVPSKRKGVNRFTFNPSLGDFILTHLNFSFVKYCLCNYCQFVIDIRSGLKISNFDIKKEKNIYILMIYACESKGKHNKWIEAFWQIKI